MATIWKLGWMAIFAQCKFKLLSSNIVSLKSRHRCPWSLFKCFPLIRMQHLFVKLSNWALQPNLASHHRRYQYILNRKATLLQNSSYSWNISLSGKCCWYTSKVFTDFQRGWMTSFGAMNRIYSPHLKCYFIAEMLKANLWKLNEAKENNQWRGFYWQIDVLYFSFISTLQ